MELNGIGLSYICESTVDDYRGWMQDAGLTDVDVQDLIPVVNRVWEQRRRQDPEPAHRIGYSLLLEDSPARLGDGLYYICL